MTLEEFDDRQVGNTWADRFEIRRRIGSGGMGVVYEAFDRKRRELVAIKTLINLSPETLIAFKREFRSLVEIRHPNLIRFGELIHAEERWFFTMELLEGQNFIEYVRPGAGEATDGILDEERLETALAQLVHGLLALQRVGMVHRDIKASNIMVTTEGRVVLLDFGLVAYPAEGRPPKSERNVVVGTVLFMSPEQAEGLPVGPESDWYSVGVLLYLALSGQYPFDGTPIHILFSKVVNDPVAIEELVPEVSPKLATLCMELMHREPGMRPTGEEVARRLGVSMIDVEPQVAYTASVKSSTDSQEFVGRSAELQRLSRELKRVEQQGTSTVLLAGPAGVGKSLLARHFLSRQSKENLLVLAGRCYAREFLPYNGFDGIIDGLSQYLADLPDDEVEQLLPTKALLLKRLFPVFGKVNVASKQREVTEEEEGLTLRHLAFDALAEILGRLAARQKVVLFIDDLHWADDESLQLLQHICTRQTSPGVLVVATVRCLEDNGTAEHGTELAVLQRYCGRVKIMELENLSKSEARTLIQTLLPAREPLNSEAVDRLAGETAGHPMMLYELTRHIGAHGFETPAGGINLAAILCSRIQGLESVERRLLEVVSVSGVPLPMGLVEVVLGEEPGAVYGAAERLQIGRLARVEERRRHPHFAVFHDRVRDVVLGELSKSERRDYHNLLADAYLANTSLIKAPLVLVDHLEMGNRPELAALYAAEAAEQAADAFAFDRAARLFRRALTLQKSTEEEQKRHLHVRLADMTLNRGSTIEAAGMYLRAAQGCEHRPRQRKLKRQAAEAYLAAGDVIRGTELLESVLQDSGLAIPSSTAGLVASTLWHQAQLKRRGLAFLPRDLDTIAADEAERLELLATASRQITYLAPVLGFNFRIRTLRLSLELGHRPTIVEGIALEAVAQAARGGWNNRRRTEDLLATARQIATTDAEYAVIRGCRGSATLFEGRTREAYQELLEAETQIRAHVTGSQRVSGLHRVLIWQAKALLDLGRLRELRPLVDKLEDEARRNGDFLQQMSLTRTAGALSLLDDTPDRLDEALTSQPLYAPLTTTGVLHWFDLKLRGELALYRGTIIADRDQLAVGYKTIGKSLFARRLVLSRVEVCWWWGRILLALLAEGAGGNRERRGVSRCIQRLRKEQVAGLADLYADMLDAGLHALGGHREDTLRLLDRVVDRSEKRGCILYGACARLHRNTIADGTGDSRQVEYFNAQDIGDPLRTAQVYLPGF